MARRVNDGRGLTRQPAHGSRATRSPTVLPGDARRSVVSYDNNERAPDMPNKDPGFEVVRETT
jgi:hypothetical protein